MQLFWLSFIQSITPVRSHVILRGEDKNGERFHNKCDLVRYVSVLEASDEIGSSLHVYHVWICQRSMAEAAGKRRWWMNVFFVPAFRFLPMTMQKNVSSSQIKLERERERDLKSIWSAHVYMCLHHRSCIRHTYIGRVKHIWICKWICWTLTSLPKISKNKYISFWHL